MLETKAIVSSKIMGNGDRSLESRESNEVSNEVFSFSDQVVNVLRIERVLLNSLIILENIPKPPPPPSSHVIHGKGCNVAKGL